MKRIFWIGLILVVLGVVVVTQRHRFFMRHEAGGMKQEEQQATKYQCPMHPQVIQEQPGNCPICGMTLQPIQVGAKAPLKAHEHKEGGFLLTPERRQAIGLKTATVQVIPVSEELRVPGRVAYDQELYVTEKEYVEALRSGGRDLLPIIEKKLERLGISNWELANLKKKKEADESLFLPKNGNGFWVYANIYEADFGKIVPEMITTVFLPSDSSRVWEGVVKNVEPVVDSMTRTLKARVWVTGENIPHSETYVDVVLKKELGEKLAIPFEAVIDTGIKQIVFVDLGEGYLEPREVHLEAKAGNVYPVTQGLTEGEKVVTSAQFLLDSESQIQAALKQFGKPATGGHQH